MFLCGESQPLAVHKCHHSAPLSLWARTCQGGIQMLKPCWDQTRVWIWKSQRCHFPKALTGTRSAGMALPAPAELLPLARGSRGNHADSWGHGDAQGTWQYPRDMAISKGRGHAPGTRQPSQQQQERLEPVPPAKPSQGQLLRAGPT